MNIHFFKILIPALLLVGLMLNYSFPKTQSSSVDIVNAMNAGNVEQMSPYFDRMVEITLHDKSNTFSNSQAEVILKDFFQSHNVESFSLIQKELDINEEVYIGHLKTSTGQFNTIFFLKSRGDQKLLQEIRFEGI